MKSSQICPSHDSCTGCEACASICPTKAIKMLPDWRGFKYPYIDSSKCTDCKMCQRCCPANKPVESFVFPTAYAFVESNTTYLNHASSGGAFGVLARYVLSKNGVVYGAEMDDKYHVDYSFVDNVKDLIKLHGSKYVQANVNEIYRDVKSKLEEGRWVLFCGCPCQVAALHSCLRKVHDRLITIDLICHGVPSQPYFLDYVNDLLKRKAKYGGFTTFRFRWKNGADLSLQHKIDNKHRVYEGFQNRDYYMTYFLWGKGYRDSCYHCKYAGGARQGDFTIGDYWNNKNTKLLSNDSNGSSLIMFNTLKACDLLDIFKNEGECKQVKSLYEAQGENLGQLHHPSKNDIRCKLIYILWRFFGVAGPKVLFSIESLRFSYKCRSKSK